MLVMMMMMMMSALSRNITISLQVWRRSRRI